MPHVPPGAAKRIGSALAFAGRRALRAVGRYIALRIISHKPLARRDQK